LQEKTVYDINKKKSNLFKEERLKNNYNFGVDKLVSLVKI